jgi:hypothetical protein
MNRMTIPAATLALIFGVSMSTAGCTSRSAAGGALVGGAAIGGVYEYQNKRALDALEDEYQRGLISRSEYERRKSEISRRSLIY